MKLKITESSMAPMAKISLNKGEKVKIERGSMVYHNGKVAIESETNGGFIKSIGRSLVSGESMFITTAIGLDEGGEVSIAPDVIGNIKAIECGDRQWILNDGVFLGCDDTVGYEIKKQKSFANALFAGTGGFFNMHTKGHGQVLISCFGEMDKVIVKTGDKFIFDNNHVVAWSDNLSYELNVASGTFGFKSGEGLVLKFTGEGVVYIQSRQVSGFARQVSKYVTKS